MKIAIREMKGHADHAACVRLQHETWGHDFTEIVPPTVLLVAQEIGGLAAGAFNESGEMLGFVFGQTGAFAGQPCNWSQMLAVRHDHRGRSLGMQLKWFQRDWALARGIEHVYWTYDPLVARNAYINLSRLGARIHSYVREMYPSDNGSILHQGMSLDRFIVEWPLNSEKVRKARDETLPAEETSAALVVNSEWQSGEASPIDADLPTTPQVRVEIPCDIENILAKDASRATAWRQNTRRVFEHYFFIGYEIVGFQRHGERRFYLLQSGAS